MKLAFIGTGKIIADALFAIEPIKEIEKTAIFVRNLPFSLLFYCDVLKCQ